MQLSDPISNLAGIGPSYAEKLLKLRINTVFDLLYHLPFRYEDRSNITSIGSIRVGQQVGITAKIVSVENTYTKSKKNIQIASIKDDSGTMQIVWFNQPYLVRALKEAPSVSFYGTCSFWGKKMALINPDFETNTNSIHTNRIIPIYPSTAGISSKWLRTKVYNLLSTLPNDYLIEPPKDLPNWKTSLQEIHFPSSKEISPTYKRRLAFDELLLIELTTLVHKDFWGHIKLAHPLKLTPPPPLPFNLTPSQSQALSEIKSDMQGTHPTNRLLIGDVGSGKTIIAALAAHMTSCNNLQTVFLSPSQVLAKQHWLTLSNLFQSQPFSIHLLTSSHKLSKSLGPRDIIVSTHSILSKENLLAQVGLVVIDEQHKFGVTQRTIASKLSQSPHVLTMTATPIPRTIALTYYGDLKVSHIQNRETQQQVTTWVVPEHKRKPSYPWITAQLLGQKTQAFWVCPYISQSDTNPEVKSVTEHYKNLIKEFPNLKLGLLHSELSSQKKDKVLSDFASGLIDILVTTPIIEVGIDIPNATIMIIEDADHFGLASLHQLRGRVGRGTKKSYCLLFSKNPSSRLMHLTQNHSGFELAELDLKNRGIGNIYGTDQHGHAPNFKITTYDHFDLIPRAKAVALILFPNLDSQAQLQSLVQKAKIALVEPN